MFLYVYYALCRFNLLSIIFSSVFRAEIVRGAWFLIPQEMLISQSFVKIAGWMEERDLLVSLHTQKAAVAVWGARHLTQSRDPEDAGFMVLEFPFFVKLFLSLIP